MTQPRTIGEIMRPQSDPPAWLLIVAVIGAALVAASYPIERYIVGTGQPTPVLSHPCQCGPDCQCEGECVCGTVSVKGAKQ